MREIFGLTDKCYSRITYSLITQIQNRIFSNQLLVQISYEIGFFIDSQNKYGRNVGAVYENGRLVEPGEATYYATQDG